MRKAPRALEDMLEHEWQSQVVAIAKQLGWITYHVYNSRRSAHGFPDLVLLRERIVYLELKREKGALTEDQKRWLRLLQAAGGQAYVARPRDLQALANLLGNPRADTPLATLTGGGDGVTVRDVQTVTFGGSVPSVHHSDSHVSEPAPAANGARLIAVGADSGTHG